MTDWAPGTRVEWTPNHAAQRDYGEIIRGTVADTPIMRELDRVWASGVRIPVDLDPPIILPSHTTGRPITVYRLYVRAQFLREESTP